MEEEQGWDHKPEAVRKHFPHGLQDNLLKVLKPSLFPALPPLASSLLFNTAIGTNTNWFHLSRTFFALGFFLNKRE